MALQSFCYGFRCPKKLLPAYVLNVLISLKFFKVDAMGCLQKMYFDAQFRGACIGHWKNHSSQEVDSQQHFQNSQSWHGLCVGEYI